MYDMLISLSPLLILIIFMYFFFLKPQKKREKDTQEMRKSAQVGDEIITIGGICGKIVRTKEESIIIQVGAEKVKFEIMRWAISTIVNRDAIGDLKKKTDEPVVDEKAAPKSSLPKKMKRAEKVDEEANPVDEEPKHEPTQPLA
ncbi:MAG: preprotein translocase subunit YajC [Eubacteriales bacterium]|nr:preprotein translocase subunit YajC [Eubacteriales bacterium]MDD4389485.1 preprotein translocase subunit YajC [Eubacteriales bacterium]